MPRSFSSYEVVNTADGAFIGDVFDADHPAVEALGARPRLDGGDRGAGACRCGLLRPGVCRLLCVERPRRRTSATGGRRQCAALHGGGAAERLWRSGVVTSRVLAVVLEAKTAIAGDLRGTGKDVGRRLPSIPATRCGILITSPLEVEGRRPRRLGVLLAGRDRRSVDELDRWFRGRFET